MKNIAIFGSSRSGKSTLSKMIVKKFPNYQIYIGDDIRSAFADVFPSLNINSSGGSGMVNDFPKYLSDLFYRSIKRNSEEFGYIVETCDITPKKAKELFNRENTILLFLGTPHQTIEQHFDEIRKYQTERDWTYDRSDEHILEHSKHWILKSQEYEKECRELNIWYVDTSFNRQEVLEKTLVEIERIIKEI